ncbi:MAG TPA: hypothetical protein VGP99_00195 [Tepidisphaeraceae bacterium]|jgi:hypothetical protein|nr:hypothetical protein [Tepidisphaeraceae bacterium]
MNRGRKSLVILLIISIIAVWAMRAIVYAQRQTLEVQRRATRLAGIDTFTLGLILGGLRGPLVMFLWTSIESQKIEKNLENIDTKIELVRMLQPQFMSVHIFQMWNKAYNLSVQVASLANKYSMILSALKYGRDVDAEQPDNINILVALGETYFQKLGSSAEKNYYIQRVRQDTLPRPAARRNLKQDVGWQVTQHDTLLDEKGFLLPNLIAPRADRPKPKPGSTMEYDGSELQYLRQFNTPQEGGFPYGVSPLALGYNYYKRGAAVQNTTGQKHLYTSDGVIDSRPGIVLRTWAEEEMERARRQEVICYGKPLPEERWDLEPLTASLSPSAKMPATDEKIRKAVAEALFEYRRASKVAAMAASDFEQHARNESFAENSYTYMYHIDTAKALSAMAAADGAFFNAMAAANGLSSNPASKAELTALYQKALDLYYFSLLRHDVEDEVAAAVYPRAMQLPAGQSLNKASVGQVDPKFYPAMYEATVAEYRRQGRSQALQEATSEYSGYLERARQRLGLLKR